MYCLKIKYSYISPVKPTQPSGDVGETGFVGLAIRNSLVVLYRRFVRDVKVIIVDGVNSSFHESFFYTPLEKPDYLPVTEC
jgi:hypothetical protein